MRIRNADKVQLVKETAIAMLVKEGFEGFSVNKLAKACGISVATLYIYYADKDDLIIQIAKAEFARMTETVLEGFDPEMSFEEGLRVQWKGRAEYMLDNPLHALFFEQLRSSSYHDKIFEPDLTGFKEQMGKFVKNAVAKGELNAMPLEVFWSVAYSPLYTLLRFNSEGRSIGGKPFTFTNRILWQAFDLVIKALKP